MKQATVLENISARRAMRYAQKVLDFGIALSCRKRRADRKLQSILHAVTSLTRLIPDTRAVFVIERDCANIHLLSSAVPTVPWKIKVTIPLIRKGSTR